jgi:hypothetical protein
MMNSPVARLMLLLKHALGQFPTRPSTRTEVRMVTLALAKFDQEGVNFRAKLLKPSNVSVQSDNVAIGSRGDAQKMIDRSHSFPLSSNVGADRHTTQAPKAP